PRTRRQPDRRRGGTRRALEDRARSGTAGRGRHPPDLGGSRRRRSPGRGAVAPRNGTAPLGAPAGDRPRAALLPRGRAGFRGLPGGGGVGGAGPAGRGVARPLGAAGGRGAPPAGGDRAVAVDARGSARSRGPRRRGTGRSNPRVAPAGIGQYRRGGGREPVVP